MRTDAIVVAPSLFDHHLRLQATSEPLQIVAELTVEAFVCAVLPWLAGIAQRHLHAVVRGPLQNGARHELRPVVWA
jgi:hypothetical protein